MDEKEKRGIFTLPLNLLFPRLISICVSLKRLKFKIYLLLNLSLPNWTN